MGDDRFAVRDQVHLRQRRERISDRLEPQRPES
jgi:hypothetical protein